MLGHFDFVYAAEKTKFQIPFINLALVPEFGSSFLLPRQIGYLQAAELIMLGIPFTAARASELGLVTSVVPDADVLAKATETAQTLAQKPLSCLKGFQRTDETSDTRTTGRGGQSRDRGVRRPREVARDESRQLVPSFRKKSSSAKRAPRMKAMSRDKHCSTAGGYGAAHALGSISHARVRARLSATQKRQSY